MNRRSFSRQQLLYPLMGEPEQFGRVSEGEAEPVGEGDGRSANRDRCLVLRPIAAFAGGPRSSDLIPCARGQTDLEPKVCLVRVVHPETERLPDTGAGLLERSAVAVAPANSRYARDPRAALIPLENNPIAHRSHFLPSMLPAQAQSV